MTHLGPIDVDTVLVIEDHPLYSDALVLTLQNLFQNSKVITACRLSEALEIGHSPSLIILDLRLPDVMGLDGFVRLQERFKNVPIALISAIAKDDVIRQFKSMGAAGYIPKSASQDDLRTALKALAEGGRHFPKGFNEENGADTENDPAMRLFELTPQQSRILTLICDGKPNKQIAFELDLAEATVKAHVTALLRRLGVRNRTQAVLAVQGAQAAETGQVL